MQGAASLLARRAIDFIYVEFSSMLRPGEDQSGALFPIVEFLLPFGVAFIASYTEQVGAADRVSLVANALFARVPSGAPAP